MNKLISEPLVQFLVLGVLLYFCIELITPPNRDNHGESEIVVSDGKLIAYLQYQRKSFNPDQSESMFASMSEQDRQSLAESFIRDEALYQEALSLGLNRNDEIIRRRLIQKMEYLAQGFYDDLPGINEEQLEAYFLENINQYRVAASISFTHVFLSSQKHDETLAKAQSLKTKLNAIPVAFDDAGQHGDRYLYNRNYIERTPDYIGSHFGEPFQKTLFQLLPDTLWQGPITSEYGSHLILIKTKTESRLPGLEEVAAIVLADAQRARQQEAQAKAIQNLIKKYTVRYK